MAKSMTSKMVINDDNIQYVPIPSNTMQYDAYTSYATVQHSTFILHILRWCSYCCSLKLPLSRSEMKTVQFKENEKININSGLRERTDKDEFVYICNCVFYIWHTGISYLISLNPMLFKNIAHVGSFKYFLFVYSCICVFMYLCICVFYIWYTGMSYLISLNPMLFKNVAKRLLV